MTSCVYTIQFLLNEQLHWSLHQVLQNTSTHQQYCLTRLHQARVPDSVWNTAMPLPYHMAVPLVAGRCLVSSDQFLAQERCTAVSCLVRSGFQNYLAWLPLYLAGSTQARTLFHLHSAFSESCGSGRGWRCVICCLTFDWCSNKLNYFVIKCIVFVTKHWRRHFLNPWLMYPNLRSSEITHVYLINTSY